MLWWWCRCWKKIELYTCGGSGGGRKLIRFGSFGREKTTEIWCLVAVEEKLYKLGGGRGASTYV